MQKIQKSLREASGTRFSSIFRGISSILHQPRAQHRVVSHLRLVTRKRPTNNALRSGCSENLWCDLILNTPRHGTPRALAAHVHRLVFKKPAITPALEHPARWVFKNPLLRCNLEHPVPLELWVLKKPVMRPNLEHPPHLHRWVFKKPEFTPALEHPAPVSYTHLTLPTIYSV